MVRKAKKRMHQMPPLSFGDKLIYWSGFLLLFVSYFILMLGPVYWRYQIAFSDSEVVAALDHASILWLIVPWMTFFLMSFILWLQPYQNRIPIFGRRNFKYGPPAWPKIYPLFMKNKPYVWVSDRKKNGKKQTAVILLVVLLISFIPFPWSLYGRDCLLHNGSIVQYNMFNRQTHEFESGEISEVKVETYRYFTGKYTKTRHYGVRMIFETDSGKRYTFEDREFRRDHSSESLYWLDRMLTVKKRFDPAMIHYDETENLSLVIADKGLSQEETRMLYQLFAQNQ